MNILSYKQITISFLSQQITVDDKEVKLDPKAFHTLKFLVDNRDRVVTSDELIKVVWDNRQINNEVVISAVGRIRKIFKDEGIFEEVIKTVHKVGYKFCLDFESPSDKGLSSDPANSMNFHKRLNWLFATGFLISSFFLVFLLLKSSPLVLVTESKSPYLEPNAAGITDTTQIFFVRHSEKIIDGTDDPALSDRGVERSKYWKRVMQHIIFDDIYTTEYIRNVHTANLLNNSKKAIKFYNPLSFDILQFVETVRGKKILIIGHSNTIPDMANRLMGSNHFEPMSHENYDLLFQVTIESGGAITSNLLHIELPLPTESPQ